MSGPEKPSREIAIAAARAASEKQAADVRVLEVRDRIVITDYFVIASGRTDRQVRTICEEVVAAVHALGTKVIRREGEREGQWVLLDFGDIVVHAFTEETREYYGLERLWRDAPEISWSDDGTGEGARRATGRGTSSSSSSS